MSEDNYVEWTGAPAHLSGSVKDFTSVELKSSDKYPDVTGKHVPLANHKNVPFPPSLKYALAEARYATEFKRLFGVEPKGREASAMMTIAVQQGTRGIDGQTQSQLLTHRSIIMYPETGNAGGGLMDKLRHMFGGGR